MTLEHRARACFQDPDHTVLLDWYEGPVQAVYTHDAHGSFYVYALRMAGAEQVYCLRPLEDVSVILEVADEETCEDAGWLLRLGRDRLIPACEEGVGVRLTVVRGVVTDVAPLDAVELAGAFPRLAQDLAPR